MLTLDITPDGGDTYRVVAKARHIVAWERLGRGRSLAKLGEGTLTLTALVEIAHITAVREGRFTGSFDEFLDSHDVTGVEPDADAKDAADDDGDESGPTPPAP